MTNLRRPCAFLLLLAMTALLAGCGKDEPVIVPNRDQFDTAVERYLRAKSMDLAIDEYIEFTMDKSNTGAVAEISLGYKGEEYGNVRTRFRFTFTQENGAWRVVSHAKAK